MQDIFGSMRQRAGDLMSDVGSEVDRQRQVRQLEKQISALENELLAGFALIGQQVVELYRQGDLTEPGLEESCRRLLEGESYLSDLNQQKLALQQTPESEARVCQTCGGELSDEGEFCPHCGASAAPQPSVMAHCGHCGAEITAGAVFCGDCGQPLDNAPVVVAATASTPAAVQPSEVSDFLEQPGEAPQPIAPAGGPVCDHCQMPLESGAEFCGNCGWLIESVAEPVTDEETETVEEAGDLMGAAAVAEEQEAIVEPELPHEASLELADDFISEEPAEAEEIIAAAAVGVMAEAAEPLDSAVDEPAEAEAVDEMPETLAEVEAGVIDEAQEADEPDVEPLEESVELDDEGQVPAGEIDAEEDPVPAADLEPASLADDEPSISAEPAAESSELLCPDCGGLLRPGATFCPSCGKQMLAPPEPDSRLARVHCGVVLDDSMNFCPECGEEVPFGETAHQFCSVCGATAGMDALFCPDCGQPMGAGEA